MTAKARSTVRSCTFDMSVAHYRPLRALTCRRWTSLPIASIQRRLEPPLADRKQFFEGHRSGQNFKLFKMRGGRRRIGWTHRQSARNPLVCWALTTHPENATHANDKPSLTTHHQRTPGTILLMGLHLVTTRCLSHMATRQGRSAKVHVPDVVANVPACTRLLLFGHYPALVPFAREMGSHEDAANSNGHA